MWKNYPLLPFLHFFFNFASSVAFFVAKSKHSQLFQKIIEIQYIGRFLIIWKIINIDMSILKIIGDLRELSILMVIKSTRKTIQKLLRKKFLLLTPT